MGKYQMDMRGEKNTAKQMKAGWNKCTVTDCKEAISKAGNQMFVIDLTLNDDPSVVSTVYAVATPKKRWFLKNLLSACHVPAAADGMYDWSESDVIGKHVEAFVEIQDEKAKVTGFKQIDNFIAVEKPVIDESIPF
jgi:hypothetical protein